MSEGERVALPKSAEFPALYVRVQRVAHARADVLYVHGATFPSDLSVFYRFDGRSWADALNEGGFNAWGFDFAGYGKSGRYADGTADAAGPVGRSEIAARQIGAVVDAVRAENGRRPVSLIAHSWGTIAAGRYAADHPDEVDRAAFFGPIVTRAPTAPSTQSAPAPKLPPYRLLTVWEQYRRFIEDVPRGHPPVLNDRHIEAWSRSYLASDPQSGARTPAAVMTPSGPIADILASWSGKELYDAGRVRAPALIVRGEWDSLCTDIDAARLLANLGSTRKHDRKIPKATHLMHLEESRSALYDTVNAFLQGRPS